MTLTQKHRLFIRIGIVVLILIGTAYLTRDLWIPLPDDTTYQDSGFSFTYPRVYDAKDYDAGTVIVGETLDNAFNPLVEVVRYESDRDVALPATFDAYVKNQAQALCGSDGAESITCTNAIATPYTSAQGLTGQEFSLTLNRKNLETGITATSTFGPVYVFNTTRPLENPTDALRYRAVFVYPSFASVTSASTSPALLTQVIDSLLIPTGVSTTTSR